MSFNYNEYMENNPLMKSDDSPKEAESDMVDAKKYPLIAIEKAALALSERGETRDEIIAKISDIVRQAI